MRFLPDFQIRQWRCWGFIIKCRRFSLSRWWACRRVSFRCSALTMQPRAMRDAGKLCGTAMDFPVCLCWSVWSASFSFQEQRGHRDRKKCIPYHRGKFYSGGIFTDDPGLLPGDRKWKDQPLFVRDAPDLLPDSDFLAAVADWLTLYLVEKARKNIENSFVENF